MKLNSHKHPGATAIIAAGLLALAVTTQAAAATYNVAGTLNCVGDLAQYDTYRIHNSGPASMAVTATTNFFDGEKVRIGLRNSSNAQITTSLEWGKGATGTKSFRLSSNSSTTIPYGFYAINARLVTVREGCGLFPPSWSGVLNQ